MSSTPNVTHRVVIPRRIDYFEVGVFSFSFLYGLITVLNYSRLASRATQIYPGVGGKVFLIMLAVGGVTGLISYLFKSITGPKLELASLTLLVLLCIAYTLWTPFSVGIQGLGLLLSLAMLIAVPGYFTRRRLVRYVHELEAIERDHSLGGEESGQRESGDAMDSRSSRRIWGR